MESRGLAETWPACFAPDNEIVEPLTRTRLRALGVRSCEDVHQWCEEQLDRMKEEGVRKSLGWSKFLGHYEAAKKQPLRTPKDLFEEVHKFLIEYSRVGSPAVAISEGEVSCFVEELRELTRTESDLGTWLREQLMGRIKEVNKAAIEAYSSAIRLPGDRELCSIMNEVIRKDEHDCLLRPLTRICRAINIICVPRDRPPEGETKQAYRGGGLPLDVRQFFQEGVKYRVPMYLSTSSKIEKANDFMQNAANKGDLPVLWIFHFPPHTPCRNANLIRKFSQFPHEWEYLFVPYSVFKVRTVMFKEVADANDPSVIELDVMPDNQKERLYLPLAPWS